MIMIRITGILIGSALAVATLIIVLGVPRFGSHGPTPHEQQEIPVVLPDVVCAE